MADLAFLLEDRRDVPRERRWLTGWSRLGERGRCHGGDRGDERGGENGATLFKKPHGFAPFDLFVAVAPSTETLR